MKLQHEPTHANLIYQWRGAGRKDADNYLQREPWLSWVLDCGLDIQFTDGSDHTLRMPVLWSVYQISFPMGKRLKT